MSLCHTFLQGWIYKTRHQKVLLDTMPKVMIKRAISTVKKHSPAQLFRSEFCVIYQSICFIKTLQTASSCTISMNIGPVLLFKVIKVINSLWINFIVQKEFECSSTVQ